MSISSKDTLAETPRVIFGHLVAQSSWHIKCTIMEPLPLLDHLCQIFNVFYVPWLGEGPEWICNSPETLDLSPFYVSWDNFWASGRGPRDRDVHYPRGKASLWESNHTNLPPTQTWGRRVLTDGVCLWEVGNQLLTKQQLSMSIKHDSRRLVFLNLDYTQETTKEL